MSAAPQVCFGGIVGGGLVNIIYMPSYGEGALQQTYLITQSGQNILTQMSQPIIVEIP